MSSVIDQFVAGPYPLACECDVVLADGSAAHIRPIRPDDAGRLVAFHARLSPETVYRRFFSPHPTLSEDEVRRFTHVDYLDRLALILLVDDEMVAVGRYDREAGSARAEVAFVVLDTQQGHGVGTLLLEHLAIAARRAGITTFIADTLMTNAAMLAVFRDAGFEAKRSFADGVVHVEFPIAPTPTYLAAVDERERRAQLASISRILQPRSIAVVGAGRRPGTIGHEVVRNLRDAGFTGPLYPVNPSADEVCGLRCYSSLKDIPGDIDVVIVTVPAAGVLDVARQAGDRHAHGLVVITAGFAEVGEGGAAAEAELVSIAHRHGMRVIGPNCFGIANTDPAISMNATFAASRPTRGPAALLSQSGAVGIAVLDRAQRRGVGVSSFVSVGNKVDVSGNDLLQFWESDPNTQAVLLYLESFGNPRKFSRVARRVSRTKPIVAVKSGRSVAGVRAARSHTASAATPDVAVDALFHQTGVIRVESLADQLDMTAFLTSQPLPAGARVAVVGNSGGPGILAADACDAAGLTLPELPADAQAALRAILPAEAAVANPVDLVAGASGPDFERAIGIIMDSGAADAVISIFTPTVVTTADAVAESLAKVAGAGQTIPLVAVFLGFDAAPQALAHDGTVVVPVYGFPEQAARVLAKALAYSRWRARPAGSEARLDNIDEAVVHEIAANILAAHEEGAWLDADDAFRVAAAYGVPVVPTVVVDSEEAAVLAAQQCGYPVALKVATGDLVHKTEAGGVQLGLASPGEVRRAFAAVTAAGGRAAASVQPMVSGGVETIVGLAQDVQFGPLVMFGLGGVSTDLLGDRAFRMAPVTDADAAEMVRSVRAAPLLTGYRGAPPVDLAALEDLVMRVGRLGENHPEVAEVDLNPVLARPDGALAVDIKIRIAPATAALDPTLRRLR